MVHMLFFNKTIIKNNINLAYVKHTIKIVNSRQPRDGKGTIDRWGGF